MILGFTGTQDGMTAAQQFTVLDFLLDFGSNFGAITEVHHGDCIGGDAEFHRLVSENLPNAKIIIHPPNNDNKRAFCKGHETLPTKDYIMRNHDIVDACQCMIAAPKTEKEKIRSGTWATVRYTKKSDTVLLLISPDGFMDDNIVDEALVKLKKMQQEMLF